MICQLTSFKKVASLLLATFASFLSFSQEAENLFHKEYSKLSFVFQPSILKKKRCLEQRWIELSKHEIHK